MPVTWCYQVSKTDPEKVYCSTGFPVGCYVTSGAVQKDACVIQVSRDSSLPLLSLSLETNF